MSNKKFANIIVLVALVVIGLSIFVIAFLLINSGPFTASLLKEVSKKTQPSQTQFTIAPLFDELARQGITYEDQLLLINDLRNYAILLNERKDISNALNNYLNQLGSDPDYRLAQQNRKDQEMQRIASKYLSEELQVIFLPITDRIQTIFIGYLLGYKKISKLNQEINKLKLLIPLPFNGESFTTTTCQGKKEGEPLPKPFEKWRRCSPRPDSPFTGGGTLIGPGLEIDYGKAPGNGHGALIRSPRSRGIGVGLKLGSDSDIIPIIGGGRGNIGGYIGHRSDCTWYGGIRVDF